MNWTGGWETGPSPARRSHHLPRHGPYQLVDTDRVLREPRMKIRSPAPGVAMLACRCGVALSSDDMVRAPTPVTNTETVGRVGAIPRIVCIDCATGAGGEP
jgi:hypothetical protein